MLIFVEGGKPDEPGCSSACDYPFVPFLLLLVQCLKCKNNSNTFDPLMDIMLDIKVTSKKLDL